MYEQRYTVIHKSLNQPTLVMGGERELVIFNITIGMTAVFGLHFPPWLTITVVAHFLLVWIARRDPMMRKIYIRYSRQQTLYDPWPHKTLRRLPRPKTFGKDLLC